MESNALRVNRFAQPISYQTGPLLWEPGTNGQHSFINYCVKAGYMPLQFIGLKAKQAGYRVQNSTSQEKLNANLAAGLSLPVTKMKQIKTSMEDVPQVLFLGKSKQNLDFYLRILKIKLCSKGFVWNISSFDQEGVQLGKVLTQKSYRDVDRF